MIRLLALSTALALATAVTSPPPPPLSTTPTSRPHVAERGEAEAARTECEEGRPDAGIQPEGQGAKELLRCLRRYVGVAPPLREASDEAALSSRHLALRGVWIDMVPHGGGATLRCRAARVEAADAVFRFPGGDGSTAGVLRSPRLVLRGPVEVRARHVRGTLLGLVPVSLGGATHAVPVGPPLFLPTLDLTDVHMRVVTVRAASADMPDALLRGLPTEGPGL
ncbi:hypothetical protein [Streptomyces sp. DH12]|uniref:hypothetical protein n=1 Tax=Streptomyces sp. DH12 TaxID=2857010 RepID=UPI001E5D5D2B|nr:hypothetical protein [Streptomyces sp. DH12]